MEFILASSSPYRKALLGRLGVSFDCHSPDIDESPRPGEAPEALAERLAIEKAQAVGKLYPSHWIIGSDQVAALDDQLLSKPGTHERAAAQLATSSDRQVAFYTGVCLYKAETGWLQCATVPTQVQFRALNAPQIDNYLKRDTPYDCAGSFKWESLGISLFEWLRSDDPTALEGLPLIALNKLFAEAKIDILNI